MSEEIKDEEIKEETTDEVKESETEEKASSEEKKDDTEEQKDEEEENKKKKRLILILLIILLILIILIALGVWFFFMRTPQTVVLSTPVVTADEELDTPIGLPDYDKNAVAIDEDSLQRAVDDMNKVEDGYITIDFYNIAYSIDGVNYDCRFGNAPENKYDTFITIYLDSIDKPYYLSGLLRPGEMFAKFEGSYALEPGIHESILVFTQINDDHTAIVGQTSVALKLNVNPNLN